MNPEMHAAIEKAKQLGTDTAELFAPPVTHASPLNRARRDLAEREEELARFRANNDTKGLAYRLCQHAADDARARLAAVEAQEVNRRLDA